MTTSHRLPDTDVPVLDITLGDLLKEAAADAADDTALVSGSDERRWTYAELDAAVDRVARSIAKLLDPGDRLAVWSTGIPEWILLQFGAARAGVVLVPLNPAYQGPEVSYALQQSRAGAVCYGPEVRGRSLHDVIRKIQPELPNVRHVLALADIERLESDPATELPAVRPDDPVMIQYTSGTTGRPKGAYLTHRGIVNNARFSALRAGVERGGAWLNPLPLFHTGGCVFNALGSMSNRAKHVLMPSWEPGSALELIEREGVTFICAVPTMIIGLMEHPDFGKRDHSTLQHVLSGGTTVPPELVRNIESTLDVNYIMVFGQTESGPTITMTGPDSTAEDKATTIGYPLPHTEVKIVDPETGATVERNTSGEICMRGYGRMLEYFELPDETATAIEPDGWLHTGDLGQMDDRGYLQITGRLKDIIRRGGETVSPRAIEDLLFAQPGVGEVAVVGVPDDKYGEQVAAFLRPAPEQELDIPALQAVAAENLAHFKVPHYWVTVDGLPLTPSGKVQKFVLRDRFVAGDFAAHTTERGK